jgi:hypothetical protein
MATIKELIPQGLFTEIGEHLLEKSREAETGWPDGAADEDTLTGDFFGYLRMKETDWRSGNDRWKWNSRYEKFSGRGKGAYEKHRGADLIFQIEITDQGSNAAFRKGMLIQAKKGGWSRGSGIRNQAQQMEALGSGGSCMVLYSASGYKAISSVDFLDNDLVGIRRKETDVGSFFVDRFLECEVGKEGLFVEGGRLNFLAANGVKKQEKITSPFETLTIEINHIL